MDTLTSHPSSTTYSKQYLNTSSDRTYYNTLSRYSTTSALRSAIEGSQAAAAQSQSQEQYHPHSIGSSMHTDHRAYQGRHYQPSTSASHYQIEQHLPQRAASFSRPTSIPATAWSNDNSMGFAAVAPVSGLKRQRSHQRTPSASTVASNGPDSPHTYNSSNPQIANTDLEPTYQSFSKDLSVQDPAFLSANYVPAAFSSDMRGVAFDNRLEDMPTPGSGHTMSTIDHDSPATPADETETKKTVFRAFNPHVQLARTESAAYQDELYNPADFRAPVAKTTKQPSSANHSHRTLVSERLATANMARSQSSSVSRDRSPFREGSQLAPASLRAPMTAAGTRAQQIEKEREETERALRRPQLQREPTKTISPKDALLEVNDAEPSLFTDTVPTGYKQHVGGNTTEVLNNAYLPQQNPTFTLPPNSSQTSMAGFRASSADFTNGNFHFTAPAIPTTTATTTSMPNPFQLNNYLAPAYASVDGTPDFPAHLTSMESSMSEGPPMSSQESAIQRPADPRAHTGTYTCTYHGCTQRFESPVSLQCHKREFHRSQQQHRDAMSAEASSASPRSTASPAPAGSGLTSAQILARNSQAGPHKCTRINPSTGKPCNTIFSRPYDLTRHEDTIHNGRKQKVRCPYCREEKTFSRNDALTRHLRVVHPDVESMGKRGRRGD